MPGNIKYCKFNSVSKLAISVLCLFYNLKLVNNVEKFSRFAIVSVQNVNCNQQKSADSKWKKKTVIKIQNWCSALLQLFCF